jgi:octopine/nopaline transport system substrate-binding protein
MQLTRRLMLAALVATTAIPAVAQEKRHVTIATEGAFAPWNMTKPDGTLEGLEIDLAADLCKRMDIECTIVAQNFDGIIPGLLAGKYDVIMAGMSATPKREETVAFSQPYGSTGQGFAVQKDGPLADLPMKGELFSLVRNPDGANKAIKELQPLLEGKTIGVQASSSGGKFIQENFGDVATIREYKNTSDHDLDLKTGRIDVIMASPAYLMTAIKEPGNEAMAIAGPRFQGGTLGKGSSAAFRKQDTELRDMFDKAIGEAKADGTMKRLSEKWFGFDVTVY